MRSSRVSFSSSSVPIVGAACNNGSKVGRYVNVNNTAGNVNWNIGASPLLSRFHRRVGNYPGNATVLPQPLLEINPFKRIG